MSIPASATDATPAGGTARRHPLLRGLLRHPSALVGLVALGLYAAAAVAGPVLLPYDPARQDLTQPFRPFSAEHWLGTDPLGRDVLTRLVYGARASMAVGVVAVALGLAIGLPAGAVSGYFGGAVDLVVQRLTDVLLSFPGMLLALALVAGLGVGLTNVIMAVGISSAPSFIRIVRAAVLSIRELGYVESARAIGLGDGVILLRHVVPNSLAPVIVQASLQLGVAILVAAGLGFLGLGVQPPTAEWGQMLGEARVHIFAYPRLVTVPGLAIVGAVLAFNLLGDALRDVLDPRLQLR